MLSAETGSFYPRHNLHHLLAGDLADCEIFDPAWGAREGRLTIRVGTPATSLDPIARRVSTPAGDFEYDRLLIACGGQPIRPPWPGADLAGVFTLRTVGDAAGMLAGRPRRALVVGGGVLGLDTLYGLHRRGIASTLLVRDRYPGKPALDPAAGEIVAARLVRLGLDVRYSIEVERLEGENGQVAAAVTTSGERLPADLVVVAIGAAPDLRWLEGSGLVVRRGVVVDGRLATSSEGVWAAGDAAEAFSPQLDRSVTGAAWRTAEHQGALAARGMLDNLETARPRAFAITQGVYDLHYTAIGDTVGDDSVVRADPAHEVYRKVVLRDGRIVGALLMGELDDLTAFERLIADATPISREEAERLVAGVAPAVPPALSPGELASGTGRNGAPVLVAVEGRVYDLSASGMWHLGLHVARHLAGRDLTAALRDAPHDSSVLTRYPVVGSLSRRPRWLTWNNAAVAAAVVWFAILLLSFVQMGLR